MNEMEKIEEERMQGEIDRQNEEGAVEGPIDTDMPGPGRGENGDYSGMD